MTRALTLSNLFAGHDDIPAVRDLDLHVDDGEMVALLGPNGAGKSTTLWTIAGMLRPISGTIDVLGVRMGRLPAHRVAGLGAALVPEGRGIFLQLTVAENLRLRDRRAHRTTIDDILHLFPALLPLTARRAGLLSGGNNRCWPSDDPCSQNHDCCSSTR